MFNFRIINTVDGNQIIDRNLKTPYDALTPTEMIEYIEMDKCIYIMDQMEMKKRKEEEWKKKLTHNPLWKLACACGIL